mmetsp:Transcript_4522/g.7539  ORF Transcript_4522/g.7539 Transcript_4522/m.7539 type:complete len:104 (-) Transcript_4522:166-477(-)
MKRSIDGCLPRSEFAIYIFTTTTQRSHTVLVMGDGFFHVRKAQRAHWFSCNSAPPMACVSNVLKGGDPAKVSFQLIHLGYSITRAKNCKFKLFDNSMWRCNLQ